MTTTQKTEMGHGTAVAEHASECCPAPKWAALITDQLFPMPRRVLAARDVLDQAGIGKEFVLVRDHDNPDDVVLDDPVEVDLGHGNVFKVIPRCEAGPQRPCHSPAKLAFVCDDLWKVTVIGKQTGHSLKRLLGLPDNAELLRDFESPNDQIIRDDETIMYVDGPVFTAKRAAHYCINIEGKEYDWSGPTITTAQIRQLGNLPADQQVVCEDAEGHERTLREDEVITLDPCCRFGRAPKYKRG